MLFAVGLSDDPDDGDFRSRASNVTVGVHRSKRLLSTRDETDSKHSRSLVLSDASDDSDAKTIIGPSSKSSRYSFCSDLVKLGAMRLSVFSA